MCLPINGLTVRPQGGLLRPVDREGLSLGSQGFHLHALTCALDIIQCTEEGTVRVHTVDVKIEVEVRQMISQRALQDYDLNKQSLKGVEVLLEALYTPLFVCQKFVQISFVRILCPPPPPNTHQSFEIRYKGCG